MKVNVVFTHMVLVQLSVRANYEDGGPGLVRKHDFTRYESENWRLSRDETNGEDEEGAGWRLAGSRRDGERWCPPSPGVCVRPLICHSTHGLISLVVLILHLLIGARLLLTDSKTITFCSL